jgi:hypothetical protein
MDEKTLNSLAIFASGYAKRWMESNYDKLMRTAAGKKLTSLGSTQKYAIEAGLYALMTYADQKLKTDTPLKKFLTEVGKDAAPEIAKRIINGAKRELEIDGGRLRSPEEKLAAQSLLELDTEALTKLLEWVESSDQAERGEAMSRLRGLSKDELEKIAGLAPSHRKILLGIDKPAVAAPTTKSSRLTSVVTEMEQWDAALEAKRDELKERRKKRFRGLLG